MMLPNRLMNQSRLVVVEQMTLQHSPLAHYLAFCITTILSLIMYLPTMSSSIAGGDSGELVAEGCQLGTSHPPGYPLYTILIYIVTQIIGGGVRGVLNMTTTNLNLNATPALLVNGMSACFGAITSGFITSSVLYLIQMEHGNDTTSSTKRVKTTTPTTTTHDGTNKSPSKKATHNVDNQIKDWKALTGLVIAIGIGLLHSTSPLAWQYSITAEVFALHSLFVSMILHTSIRFAIYGTQDLLLLGAFLCGTSLTNQHTSILLIVPIISWVLYETQLYKPRYFWTRKINNDAIPLIFQAAFCFLIGFIFLYGTMPLWSMTFPHAGSWGNVSSIQGFLNHFRRKDYGTFRLFSGNDDESENVYQRTILWFHDYFHVQATPIFGTLTMIGCWMVLQKEIKHMWKSLSSSAVVDVDDVHVGKSKSTKTMSLIQTTGLKHTSIDIRTMILCSLVFYLVVFHSLANLPLNNPLFFGVHQRFWMHPNILCFILSGVGLSNLMLSKEWVSQIGTVLLVVLTWNAARNGMKVNDQSDNVYFRNYAMSILRTLPKDSILFTNYDQQWTSIRYLQECEAVRKDITTINLSMMSYDWWASKKKLYPQLTFPGKYYTRENTQRWLDGGFTFSELLKANTEAYEDKIFLGGHLSYHDSSFEKDFDEIPHGIVRKIVKKDKVIKAEQYRQVSYKVWKVIANAHGSGLPDEMKYKEDTWEWTIRREFFDHFLARATHLLDLAVTQEQMEGRKLHSLSEACAWIEMARLNDKMTSESPSVWKNLGLGYMSIVRNKEKSIPAIGDIFQGSANSFLTESMINIWWDRKGDVNEWKAWSTTRWSDTWGLFLEMKGANQDPSYEGVKSMYDSVMSQRKQ